jgi:hypothetical protein
MKLILSVLLVLVASCSSPEVVSGHYFDEQWVDSIVAGETTMDDIREWFGEPIWSSSSKKGQLVFHYENCLGPVVPAGSSSYSSGGSKRAGKSIVVAFKDAVVYYHSFSENDAGYEGTVISAGS